MDDPPYDDGARIRIPREMTSRAQDACPLLGPTLEDEPNDVAEPAPGALVALAKRTLRIRRARIEVLPASLFGEAGWDMLLALYCYTCAGQRVTVTNLCLETPAAQTTAIRWIDRLFELKLVARVDNPKDGRSMFIEMTPTSFHMVDEYLCHVWRELHSVC